MSTKTLKKEIKLLKEEINSPSTFIRHAYSILKRHGQNPEEFERVKKEISEFVNLASQRPSGTLQASHAHPDMSDEVFYGLATLVVPPNFDLDAIAAKAKEASDKTEADKQAFKKYYEDKAKLSPEEKAAERVKQLDIERKQTHHVYGKSGKLGT